MPVLLMQAGDTERVRAALQADESRTLVLVLEAVREMQQGLGGGG